MHKLTKISDWLLISFFIILISIPCIGIFVEREAHEIRTTLNREPYQFPPISIKRIGRTDFKAIENWFGDKALFITSLSKFWANTNYKLGVSIKPGQAIIGKRGWLFLGNDYNATIDQYTGKNVPTNKEIFWRLNTLKHMQQIATRNNIPFLVVIAPDKQDIYPEYLPSNILRGERRNRLDFLEEGMSAHGIDFISLRPTELEAKNTLGKQYGDLYLKGDSHWNYLGAYVAYQAIADYLQQKGIATANLKFNFLPGKVKVTDLTTFLQLTDVESNSPTPDIAGLSIDMLGIDEAGTRRKLNTFEGIANDIILNGPYQSINQALPNKQTCLLISDSFSTYLGFYFHNDFQNTVQIHHDNTTHKLSDLINKYHPNIIVYESVERALSHKTKVHFDAEPIKLKLPAKRFPVNGGIDKLQISQDKIIAKGWAYLVDKDAANSEIYLKFSNGTQSYLFSVNPALRPDILLSFKNGEHLNLTGFNSTILRKDIPKGEYTVSLIVLNINRAGEIAFSEKYQLA